MALQGTLDTFSLPDVLRLLATTGKSGCLHLEGDRGRGSVWLDDGAVVAATAERALDDSSTDEVIFEMLRYGRGSFNFAADEPAPDENQQPRDVESTLRRATQLLDEWSGLESVVPSLSHRVALAPELTVDQVTIDAPRWTALVAIASGRSVGELAESLSLGELGVSRTVSDLVELGVAVVEPPGAARAPSSLTSRRNSVDRSASGEVPRRAAASTSASNKADTVADARREPAVSSKATRSRTTSTPSTPPSGNGRGSWLDEARGVTTKTSVETAPKSSTPKAPKTPSASRAPRTRRTTGPTATTAPPTPPNATAPVRNGRPATGTLGSLPMAAPPAAPPLPAPSPALPERSTPTSGMPVPPLGPSPETLRGPILPSSLDTGRLSSLDAGRLGPSPLPPETGQIPSVAASSLPPDLSWAAEDRSGPAPAPHTPAPGTLRAPGSGRLHTPPQGRRPSNGHHQHQGDMAPHVGAMSDAARAAVEATIGRSGGGQGGMQMAGASPEQMMSRDQLLHFLSSVRP